MSDRKEYFKKYRLEHKEKYREYQRKYRGTHLSTYKRLQKENQELKKQLSNIHQIKNQQKEFIDYLEEPIKIITEGNPTNISEYTSAKLDALKEVLQKYKEIIGGKK